LCPSLVEEARKRVAHHGWEGLVEVVLGDATDLQLPGLPPPASVDVVTFSYALTMIPDWHVIATLTCLLHTFKCVRRRAALRNAFNMLKVGGHICVCDFTVDQSQWYLMPNFWKWVFAHDTVYPTEEHVPALEVTKAHALCYLYVNILVEVL
jgi:S-adenosylmethionine-diacylgycerolhomoserine-N-methlytransferase